MSAIPKQIFTTNATGCNTPGLAQQLKNFKEVFPGIKLGTNPFDKGFAERPLAPSATARYLLPRLDLFGGYDKAIKIALETLDRVRGLKMPGLAGVILKEGNILQKQRTTLAYQTLCEQSGSLLIVDVRLGRDRVGMSEREATESLRDCEYGLSLLAGVMAALIHEKLFDILPKGASRIVFPGTKSVLSGPTAELTTCMYRAPGEKAITIRTVPRSEARADHIHAIGVPHF